MDKKLASDLSKYHKNNLRYSFNYFMEFLDEAEREMSIRNLTTSGIEEFLQLLGSHTTYYMNRRRDLNILFNLASRMVDEDLPAAKRTESRRVKATLHLAYEKGNWSIVT